MMLQKIWCKNWWKNFLLIKVCSYRSQGAHSGHSLSKSTILTLKSQSSAFFSFYQLFALFSFTLLQPEILCLPLKKNASVQGCLYFSSLCLYLSSVSVFPYFSVIVFLSLHLCVCLSYSLSVYVSASLSLCMYVCVFVLYLQKTSVIPVLLA